MSSDRKEDSLVVPFEEALNKAGFGVYSYILTALTGVSIISFSCVVYGSTIIVPTSACELDTTPAQQGLLVAVPLIGTIIGAVLWGYLADTRGRKNMLLVSFLTGATVNALASISVNWVMLMILQFTASLLASGQYSLPMTILSESVPMVRRNLVVLLVTSIFLLSQGTMAVLAIPIIPLSFSYYVSGLDIYWNSWRTLILVYCIPAILSAIWLCFMEESPKFVFAKGDEEGALNILRRIHRLNNRNSKEELQVKGLSSEAPLVGADEKPKNSVKELFVPPLVKYTVIMTTLSCFLQRTADPGTTDTTSQSNTQWKNYQNSQIGAFMAWLPTIADQFVSMLQNGEGGDLPICSIIDAAQDFEPEPEGTPCALNGTALLIVFAVGAIQSFVNGFLSLVINKVGRRNMVMVITAVCGCAGVAVNWVPNAIGSAFLYMLFLVGLLCLGLYTAISVALFPTHLRALAVSLTMTGGRITSFGMIQLLNYLFLNNCELGFYIFGALFASSAIIAAFLPDDRLFNKPKSESIEDRKTDQDSEKTEQYTEKSNHNGEITTDL